MIFLQIKMYDFLSRIFGKHVIHVETIHIDEHFKNLLNHVKKYKCKCFCMTPENYDMANIEFVIGKSKRDYANILKERYNALKNYADLQLHVHLAVLPERLSKERKYHLIKSAYDFFITELGITPKEIVFGWFASDAEADEIAKSMGLKIIRAHYHLYDRDL